MKIGLDARCLNRTHLRGMGKYVWNLLAHLRADDSVEWGLFGDRPELPTHIPPVRGVSMEVFELKGYRFQTWEQLGLPKRVKKSKADVLHCTSTTLPWHQPVPTVVTIHDTIPWTTDELQDRIWYWCHLLPAAYRKCAAIITISECSRKDILKLWPSVEPKLHVIRHGVESAYFEVGPGTLGRRLRAAGIRAPYLLYLGGDIARKRLDWAIRVWQNLRDPQLQLVVCGVESASKPGILEKHVSPDVRELICFAPFISEADMPRLYQNAIGVLYPTLYEGFGLPIIEAQAAGTPVLLTAVASLAELHGPGVFVLPPNDLEAWVTVCRQLIAERRESPFPRQRSREWARQFSWMESARRHLEVYRAVVCRNSL
jgi:glycosyltransferase involved in cell wall biosynthesis